MALILLIIFQTSILQCTRDINNIVFNLKFTGILGYKKHAFRKRFPLHALSETGFLHLVPALAHIGWFETTLRMVPAFFLAHFAFYASNILRFRDSTKTTRILKSSHKTVFRHCSYF